MLLIYRTCAVCVKRYLCTARHFENEHVFEGSREEFFRELDEKSKYQLMETERGTYGANERLAGLRENRVEKGGTRAGCPMWRGKRGRPVRERGPKEREGDRSYPHFRLTLSPPTKACVACPISHFSPIDTYNTDTNVAAAAANRMYQHIRKRPCAYLQVVLLQLVARSF